MNSVSGMLKWHDTFLILYCMFICDFIILSFLLAKAAVIGLWSICRRDGEIFTRYCSYYEVFLALVTSYSVPMYFLFEAFSERLSMSNKPIKTGLDTKVLDFLGTNSNIDKILNLLLLHIIIGGIIIVHFSPRHSISIEHLKILMKRKDNRKAILEKKGFLFCPKEQFIFSFQHTASEAKNTPRLSSGEERHLLSHRPDQEPLEGRNELLASKQSVICSDCSSSKCDLIMKPCLHFELCSDCYGGKYPNNQACPVCKQVPSAHQSVASVLVVEQVIGSTNFKVLQEYIPKSTLQKQ